jgi:hypothetical protein
MASKGDVRAVARRFARARDGPRGPDVDLVILADDPALSRTRRGPATFGCRAPRRRTLGRVTSVRAWFATGVEVDPIDDADVGRGTADLNASRPSAASASSSTATDASRAAALVLSPRPTGRFVQLRVVAASIFTSSAPRFSSNARRSSRRG